jgi:ferredoxin-NADP reductase
MAGTAVLGRLTWTLGRVVELIDETPRVRTLVLDVPDWDGHRAGQHVDVRLTADDGYQAQRSYSIASGPRDRYVSLTVERLDDGEVSPYLVGDLRAGDKLELRGPIGGYFVWEPRRTEPLLLLAGGTGIAPLMSMLRHRGSHASGPNARLLFSSRTWDDVIYRDELERLAALPGGPEVVHTLTRGHPPGWSGYTRRVDAAMLADVAWEPSIDPIAFVCGPTPFVEAVASALVILGYPPQSVKTERFGPTGG